MRSDAPPTTQDARPGEALPLGKLANHLAEALPALGPLRHVRQFTSGFSNLTYLLECAHGRAVLRRPPYGPRQGKAHDMGREFAVLRALAEQAAAAAAQRIETTSRPAAPTAAQAEADTQADLKHQPGDALAPRPLHYCADESVVGAPFYLMEYVAGEIIRAPTQGSPAPTPPQADASGTAATSETGAATALGDATSRGQSPQAKSAATPGGQVDRDGRSARDAATAGAPKLVLDSGTVLGPTEAQAASQALVLTLARLHELPLAGSPLIALGRAEGYVERQVEGWIGRFERARTPDVRPLGTLSTFLREARPADRAGALVHNDYKFDNVVFAGGDFTRVARVLDWEMCTVGNDLMDLGLTLAYWAHPEEVAQMPFLGINATHFAGFMRRPELVDVYLSARGLGERERAQLGYYFAFGNVKIAGIVQQIYARYVAGHTRDARFGQLGAVANYLLTRAEQALDEM